ncbi:MAG: DUF58 domain-containing protein [Bifidobacteriaceae bacterium]|jgi:uncharacterized protein (DUF58 family)|nr:DUF58 domain-containing protein [Bifidobacteriaceae bacterium]
MVAGESSARAAGGVRPWGWAALALGLSGLAVGWWLGWPELAVPGGCATATFLAGSVSTLGRPRLAVALETDRQRVEAGGSLGVRLRIVNLGRRRVRPRGLMLPIGARLVPVRVRALAPGREVLVDLTVPATARGLLRIGPPKAFRGDPFGLALRTWDWGAPSVVAVYPRTARVVVGAPGLIRDVEGRPTGQAAQTGLSFHALREYQPGDDIRSVHWRSSARLGQIMVRESEDIRRVRVVLIISAAREEYGGARDFELAVSVFASVGLSQLGESGDLAVMDGQVVLGPGQVARGRLLDQAAALVLGGPSSPSTPSGLSGLSRSRGPAGLSGPSGSSGSGTLAGAAARARREAPSSNHAILVTGGRLAEDDLRRIAQYLPPDASVVALRCDTSWEAAGVRSGRTVRAGGASRSVRVADTGRAGRAKWARIGRLEDLPQTMAKLTAP